MERGVWQATVHGVAKSQTRLNAQHEGPGTVTVSAPPQVILTLSQV